MKRKETEEAISEKERDYLSALFHEYGLMPSLHYNKPLQLVELRAKIPRLTERHEKHVGPVVRFLALAPEEQRAMIEEIKRLFAGAITKRTLFLPRKKKGL